MVEAALQQLGLPPNAPLSVLAVEFYSPGGSVGEGYTQDMHGRDPAGPGDPFDATAFGQRRILRTSPLVPVQPVC